VRLWRISNFVDLSGQGGLFVEGRWHVRGVPVVYCADHPSTALLEILVQTTRQAVPESYQLIEIHAPDDIAIFEPANPDALAQPQRLTRQQGMDFLSNNRSVLMRVRSAVMPRADNYLINPLHPDAGRISIQNVQRYPFDTRLIA
jgi:RES domain-containing protein